MKHNTIIEIISILFMILFLYTGISKLMDHTLFKEQLAESPVLRQIAPAIAWGLPTIEFIAVVLLFIPKWRLKGLYAALTLMIVFTIYVIVLVSFNDKLPCSCGGVLEQLSWQQHLVFNSIFTTLAAWAIWLHRRIQRMNNQIHAAIA